MANLPKQYLGEHYYSLIRKIWESRVSEIESKALNGVDIAWLRMDSPTNLMIINAMIITESLDFLELRKTIITRFLRFPRFRTRPLLRTGQYYWEEDPLFDIDNHVKRVALPGAADKRALQQFVADQVSEPLDASRPMWQILFVDNYQGGNAIILRVHHCYADGLALISVFNSITDSSPNIAPFATVSARASNEPELDTPSGETNYEWPRYQRVWDAAVDRADRYKEFAKRISQDGLGLIRDQEAWRGLVGDGVRAAAELAQLATMPADPRKVLKGKLGVRKNCAWSEPVSFDKFHGIAKVVGCKINDLLLSCVAGAFREELMHAGQEVDGKKIHVTLPVNMRSEEKMDMGGNPEELGNYFGTVFVPLPVGIENPLERVYKIKHDMIALKQSLQPALSYGILYAAGLMPRNIQKSLLESFGNKTSAVLSNVPGPRQARYIAGSRIKEQMFWVPQTGDLGLGLSIISYGGQIQFGMVGDARLFPHPERIVNRFVSQIELHRTDIVASYIEDLVQPTMAS
ncbi:MAG: wax ester/triacylglycerol synthase family O-acyltransferase [Oleiphilaceae bacterium]|nr:wax ester/triacylglycerol synthase family O-acyltransferase [Oleiphilaceae bacterium]